MTNRWAPPKQDGAPVVRGSLPGLSLAVYESLTTSAVALLAAVESDAELAASLMALPRRAGASQAAIGEALRALAADCRSILFSPDLGWRGVGALLQFQHACFVADGVELTPEGLRHLAQNLEHNRRPSLEWWSP